MTHELRSCDLRHRVTIEAEAPGADGGGGQGADPWAAAVTVAVLWARIEPLTGSERLAAQRLEPRVSHRVTLRWRSGITAQQRLRFGARVFNIRAVLDPEERRRFLVLLCEEGVAT